jgi:hypothetical protein
MHYITCFHFNCIELSEEAKANVILLLLICLKKILEAYIIKIVR